MLEINKKTVVITIEATPSEFDGINKCIPIVNGIVAQGMGKGKSLSDEQAQALVYLNKIGAAMGLDEWQSIALQEYHESKNGN